MEIEVIKSLNTEDYKISTIIKDYLYYLKDNKIYKRNIYNYDEEVLLCNTRKDSIKSIGYIEGDVFYLLLGYEEHISIYNVTTKTLNSIEIEDYLIKYITYGNNIILVYVNNKIKIYDIHKNKINERNINVYTKGKISEGEVIKDLYINDKYTIILSTSGYIYKTYSILYKDSILLGNPLKMIPEPVDSNVEYVYEHLGYFYLCYENYIEVYRINDDILVLLYRYNTKYYRINIGTYVYCLDSNLVILDKYPKLLYKKNIVYMHKDIAISEDHILMLRFQDDKKSLDTSVSSVDKIDISNFKSINNINFINKSYQDLFCNLRSEFVIPTIRDTNVMVEAKKTLNKFEENVVDKYRKLYYELSTLNESMIIKKEKLKRLENIILDSSVKLEERRNNLIERIVTINKKYVNALHKVKIDGKCIKEYVKIIEDKIKETRDTDNSALEKNKYLKILKLQRHVLTNKIGR